MKSFLVKDKRPTIMWSRLPENIFFKGKLPEGYDLAISPSDNYIVVDVDRHGKIDGFDNVPIQLYAELNTTLHYHTKNNGMHYWFQYTGNKILANRASGLGIDLRTNKGYVVWYLKDNFEDCIDKIKQSSLELNKWLEKLFSHGDNEILRKRQVRKKKRECMEQINL